MGCDGISSARRCVQRARAAGRFVVVVVTNVGQRLLSRWSVQQCREIGPGHAQVNAGGAL